MFTGFFNDLRREGIPVSVTEWMTLMDALHKGLAGASLTGFYYLARAVLVKSESYYDRFDVVFQRYFHGIETPPDLVEQVIKWLERSLPPLVIDPEKRKSTPWNLDEMRRALMERLAKQTEEHHGGSHWIGTGGTSPFGHSGHHPAGLRIGGKSVNRSAVKVAAERRYRDFRRDETLSTRQFEMALRKLRELSQNVDGPKDELDLEATIDATCKNAGWLKIIWERSRKNLVKVVIMMDSGGSMEPHAQLCGRLFNAANKISHFKDLRFYYFHNAVYDRLYLDPFCRYNATVPVKEVLQKLDREYRLILVGDASMAPSELLMPDGSIYWDDFNEETGYTGLKKLADHFTHTVWLNPVPLSMWDRVWGNETIAIIRRLFPMFELTVDGLEQAIKKLKALLR